MYRRPLRGRITIVPVLVHRIWPTCLALGVYIVALVYFATAPNLVLSPDAQLVLQQSECGLPGITNPALFGPVGSQLLPWVDAWPERLRMLQETHQAHLLIAAFRTTLPDPPILNEIANVRVAAGLLTGTTIQPGERVSLSSLIGPFTSENDYVDGPTYIGGRVVPTTGGGVCKVATAMYNVATISGMVILERHPHSMQVPYAPPGRDAAIAWGYKDLKFQNPYDRPVILWAQVVDSTLYTAVYGSNVAPEVEWHHQELAREPMPVLRRENPLLGPGEERILPGYDGLTTRTWLSLRYPDGTTEERDLGTDHYRPMAQIVEYGPEA